MASPTPESPTPELPKTPVSSRRPFWQTWAFWFFLPVLGAVCFQVCTRVGGGAGTPNDAPLDPTTGILPSSTKSRALGLGCGSPLFGSAPGVANDSTDTDAPVVDVVPRGSGQPSGIPSGNPNVGTPGGPSGGTDTPSAASSTPVGPTDADAIALIEGYYRDLNAGKLEASLYFAPFIERFISMNGTTPAAINQYIHGVFKKQFTSPNFEYETGSLTREGEGTYTYVERSRYYFVAKKRQVDQRYRVRIRVQGGKMVYFHQFQKAPRPNASPVDPAQ